MIRNGGYDSHSFRDNRVSMNPWILISNLSILLVDDKVYLKKTTFTISLTGCVPKLNVKFSA